MQYSYPLSLYFNSHNMQGVLTKFVHEKRKSQQLLAQQEECDEDQQNELEDVDKNTQAKETKKLTLPAASRAEKSYGAAIVKGLGGTWLGLDHEVKKHHNSNTTASQPGGLWLDESDTNRETYQNVIRGDARSVIGSHQELSDDEEDEYSSHDHGALPSASNSNKNLLELLGWSPKSENDDNDNKESQNRRKSDVGLITAQLKRRPAHTATRLSKSCTGKPQRSSHDQDEIQIDSNNHIKNWFNNFGGGGKKQAEQKASSSCEAGVSITSSLITDEKALAKRPSPHSIMDEFEGAPQLQAPPFLELESGRASTMPQVNRPRSCLKRSSSDINYVSDTSALLDAFNENSDDNKVGAEHLIHMLLTLDSGPPPSKETTLPSNNHRGAKEEEDPPQKLALSQEPTSKFKYYKPRSKQIQVNSDAYPPDNTSLIRNPPQKLELSQEPISKFQYRPRSKHSRSIATDQQIHKVNAAENTATASLSSSPSPSLMSTGSVNDMRRRHIRKISRRNESFDNVDSNSKVTLKKQVPSDVPQHTTTTTSNSKKGADVDLLTRYFQNKAKNQAVEDPSPSQLLVNWPSSDDEDVDDDDDTDGITITPNEVASKRVSDLTIDGEEMDEIEQLDPVEISKQCKRNSISIDSIAECLHEDDSFEDGEHVTPRDNDLVINTGKNSLLHELLNVDGSEL